MNTIKYLLVNTVFAIVIYLGLFEGVEWAENVAYFLAWLKVVVSFFVLSDRVLEEMIDQKSGTAPPLWLRRSINSGTIATFVFVGSWVLGGALLFSWLLVEGARTRAGELKQRSQTEIAE